MNLNLKRLRSTSTANSWSSAPSESTISIDHFSASVRQSGSKRDFSITCREQERLQAPAWQERASSSQNLQSHHVRPHSRTQPQNSGSCSYLQTFVISSSLYKVPTIISFQGGLGGEAIRGQTTRPCYPHTHSDLRDLNSRVQVCDNRLACVTAHHRTARNHVIRVHEDRGRIQRHVRCVDIPRLEHIRPTMTEQHAVRREPGSLYTWKRFLRTPKRSTP